MTFESVVIATITSNVGVELGIPIRSIRRRAIAVMRAGVPEASVNEDGDAFSAKD